VRKSPDAPICRWRHGDDVLDVMPVEHSVLKFKSEWHGYGIQTAVSLVLEDDLCIRILSAPAFLATKWEAFEDRGGSDDYGSSDIEDIVTVVAGRPEVVGEIREAEGRVRGYIATQTSAFLGGGATPEVIAGTLPDARLMPGLVRSVEERLFEIARL
jgi:hypothetical protein